MSAAAIIGVGPGLGSALARRFAAGGLDLLLLNRSRPPMAAVVAELSRSRTRVDVRQVDVTDRASLVAAMTAGAARLGPNFPPHLSVGAHGLPYRRDGEPPDGVRPAQTWGQRPTSRTRSGARSRVHMNLMTVAHNATRWP